MILAYLGKTGCTSPTCRHRTPLTPGSTCYGWHCITCHEPTGDQGHDCPTRIEPYRTAPYNTPELMCPIHPSMPLTIYAPKHPTEPVYGYCPRTDCIHHELINDDDPEEKGPTT